MTIKKLVIVHQ
jgi:hypothetical protein